VHELAKGLANTNTHTIPALHTSASKEGSAPLLELRVDYAQAACTHASPTLTYNLTSDSASTCCISHVCTPTLQTRPACHNMHRCEVAIPRLTNPMLCPYGDALAGGRRRQGASQCLRLTIRCAICEPWNLTCGYDPFPLRLLEEHPGILEFPSLRVGRRVCTCRTSCTHTRGGLRAECCLVVWDGDAIAIHLLSFASSVLL
jgi:hypothetical protein